MMRPVGKNVLIKLEDIEEDTIIITNDIPYRTGTIVDMGLEACCVGLYEGAKVEADYSEALTPKAPGMEDYRVVDVSAIFGVLED